MTPSLRTRPRSSPALRMVMLTGLLVAVRHFMAPAYSVGGSWEGSLADAKTLPKGLDQMYLDGLNFGEGNLGLSVEDGRMHASWSKGPLSVSTNDAHEWQFNFTTDDGWLRSRGTGTEIDWEAGKKHSIDGLGEVSVNMSSGKVTRVLVTPSLPQVAGVQLDGYALTDSRNGLQGRLEASKQLFGKADMNYVVQNLPGAYDPKHFSHTATIDAQQGDNKAALSVSKAAFGEPKYDLMLTRDLEALLQEASEISVGVNNKDVYAKLAANKALVEGLTASYKFSGRAGLDANHSNPSFVQSLKLKHELAKLMLSHATGKPVKAVAEIGTGTANVHTSLAYDLDTKEPTYNVTLNGDLTDLAQGQLTSASVQVGVDSKGPYGDVEASRELGDNGLKAEYSSKGRLDALEHALKVSNKQMHARIVKAGSNDPRLQLGYELEV